jgi:hypothetical protein
VVRGFWVVVALVMALVFLVACGGGSDSSSTTAEDEVAIDDVDSDEPTEKTPEDDESVGDDNVEPEAAPTEADLETIVLEGWDLIWDEDFSSLIELYNQDCQARLSTEDFDATLSLGVTALRDLNVNFDDIVVDVAVSDFSAGESATSTSTLTFPGEEPGEEDPAFWAIEDGAWAKTDCDEIAGAGSAGLPDGSVGTIEMPAAYGSVYDMEDWRATVVDLVDPLAEGFLADFTEEPPAGFVDVMVVYIGQYFGEEIGSLDPFLVRGIGSEEYESFDSDCALDGLALSAQGLSAFASAVPGQQLTFAECLTVPEDEAAALVVQIEHAFSFSAPVVNFSAVGTVAPDPGPREEPVVDLAAGATAFGETIPLGKDWTFSLVAVADGVAEGLMSEFGEDPPEGSTHAVIVYEATYSGADEVGSDPFIVEGLGSAVYDELTSLCSVDGAAADDAYGTTVEFEFPPGETYRQAVCITVPQSEVAELVVKAGNVFDFEADPVRFSG